MFNKVNINQVVKNHLATLKNDNTDKAGFDDYVTFLILPLGLAISLTALNVFLSEQAINIVITTLSIFVGLLFNVIVLIFDIIKRDPTKKIKNEVLKELVANISFTILISIVSIVLTIFTFIENPCIKIGVTSILYFFLILFLLTILMILKRMHKLFTNEIEELENSGNKRTTETP